MKWNKARVPNEKGRGMKGTKKRDFQPYALVLLVVSFFHSFSTQQSEARNE